MTDSKAPTRALTVVCSSWSAVPRSAASNGGMGQTLADLKTTATKKMRCPDPWDGRQWRWRWRWRRRRGTRWRTRTKTAAVEERPSVTPASTSQAQERPRDSDVEGRRCRGGARMPGRGRPDGVAAAASRLASGGSRERRRALRRPSRPNRGNRWEAGCNSRLGGLPKDARIWPR
jgi:hypothetical protein